MPRPDPFTYYRNSKERRAWLVADVDPAGTFNNKVGRVVLIEWGKTRNEPTYITLEAWDKLVMSGRMELFTPQLPKT